MSSQQPLTRQDAETLYWLDLARRVLAGEVDLDEACSLLDRDSPVVEAAGQGD